jgi:PAS domain S-box-containing protein
MLRARDSPLKFTLAAENARVKRLSGAVMSSQALPAQAKELFHYLFEQASLGIAVEDLEGTLLLANPALCSMLGYADNELCGMNCSQFANPEDSQDDWALFQQLRAGAIDQYSLEKRYVRKDGAKLWGRLNVSLLKNDNGGSPLVFAFLENITERRRTEDALRESEQRFRLAAYAGKMFSYEWDAATDVIARSGEYAGMLCADEVTHLTTGRKTLAKVHPDDQEKVLAADAALSAENPHLRVSHRMAGPDGDAVWVERTGRAHFDKQGKMLRIVGMVADITERKTAEAALADVSRRLIEAQEQERSRIARELHDDIGQRLALLAVELEQLHQDPPDLPEVRNRTGELHKQASELASDIQTLSHELHSTKLEYLGAVGAMRDLCRELGEPTKVKIDFKSQDVPNPLPSNISLCLFRVLQESLRNALKHSGAPQVEVELRGTPDEILLVVSDGGVGFDSKAAKGSSGLGLVSMEERLKLLRGTISIDSKPKHGTTIHARVPLSSGSDSMRAG